MRVRISPFLQFFQGQMLTLMESYKADSYSLLNHKVRPEELFFARKDNCHTEKRKIAIPLWLNLS